MVLNESEKDVGIIFINKAHKFNVKSFSVVMSPKKRTKMTRAEREGK